MPVNVLHILETTDPAGTGIASIVGALADGLDPRRYRTHALFLDKEGPLADRLRSFGAQVACIDWDGTRHDPWGALHYWRWIRQREFAILHQHAGARSVRWITRFATPARIIVHFHGRVCEPQGLTPLPLAAGGSDIAITNSRSVAELVAGKRVRVVYPGVGIRNTVFRSARSPGRPLIVGTACRLEPVKGLTYLIGAMALLKNEDPEIRLEIAGEGTERPRLEQQVRALGLQDRVRFLGWKDDLLPVFAGWDVYAQPSVEEAFGIAALEAMAAGLPVVASAVGGTPELVEHGRTGVLVTPSSAKALAEGLRAILRSPDRIALGRAAQERAQTRFSVSQMVDCVAQVYEEVLQERPKTGP